MKKLIVLFLFLGLFISCNKDKEDTCAVSDFVGVWQAEGEVCILNDATTLTITDVGAGKIHGEYTGNGVTSDFDDWTVDGCAFTGSLINADWEFNITINGTLTDGKLSIKNTGTVFGVPFTCTETFTK